MYVEINSRIIYNFLLNERKALMFKKYFLSLAFMSFAVSAPAEQNFELNDAVSSLNNSTFLILEVSPTGTRLIAMTQGLENNASLPLFSDETSLASLQVQVEQDIQQLLQEPTEENVRVLIDSLRVCIKAELQSVLSDSDIGFTLMYMLKLHRDLLSVCESQPHDPASIVDYINDMAILG